MLPNHQCSSKIHVHADDALPEADFFVWDCLVRVRPKPGHAPKVFRHPSTLAKLPVSRDGLPHHKRIVLSQEAGPLERGFPDHLRVTPYGTEAAASAL